MAHDVVKVLIVDDQAPFRDAAKAVVDMTPGFEVIGTVDSGEVAVAKAESLAPDLVLMDINMEGMNGGEAANLIAAARSETVTFLLSTYELADLPAAARSSAATAYIHKEEFGPDLLSELWASRAGAHNSRSLQD